MSKIEWSGTPGPWEAGTDSDWSVDTESSNAFIHVGPASSKPVAIVIETGYPADDERLDYNARAIAEVPAMVSALIQ